MNKLLAALTVALLAACGEENAPEEDAVLRQAAAKDAVALFFETCIPYVAQGKGVTKQGFAELDEQAVKKLPFGMMEINAQKVWQGKIGANEFFISTAADGGCSVKTQKADENTARQAFRQASEQGFAGMTAHLRGDNGTTTPFPVKQLVYSWLKQDSTDEILLTANTSVSDQLPAQLALHAVHKGIQANVSAP